jgi:hypothetical protein
MQVMHMILRQYRLLHLQVHLLLAKEDLIFLQRLVEADELFGHGARGVHLVGKEVLLESLGSDATGITFRAHLSKGALKSHQSIFPPFRWRLSCYPAPSRRQEADPAAQWPPHLN